MISTLRRWRYKAARTSLRRPLIWLRHRGLDPRDVFLASYPRSGQYWLRFQLVELLTTGCADFDGIDRVIPKMGVHVDAPVLLPNGGRIIQTHERYRREYGKAIYLVRDGRDVLLSEYAQEKRTQLPYTQDFSTYISAFLRGKVQGFAPWHAHVSSWLDSRAAKAGDLLLIRYEDMRSDAEGILSRTLDFLEVSVPTDAIRKAVRNNSLQQMRAKEDQRSRHKSAEEDGRHVRQGSVGGWREKLSAEQAQLFEQHAAEALVRLGYPLFSQVAASEPAMQPQSCRS